MLFRVILSMITGLVIVLLFFKLNSENKMQREIIRKINEKNKKKNSFFDINAYISNHTYIKAAMWRYQKNSGKDPCDLKRKIKVTNYSENINFIICKKGL